MFCLDFDQGTTKNYDTQHDTSSRVTEIFVTRALCDEWNVVFEFLKIKILIAKIIIIQS